MLVAVSLAPAAGAEFELVRVLGAAGGVQPPQRFSGPAGKLIFGQPDLPLRTPDSLTVDPAGRVWITDRGTRSVHMYDTARRKFRVLKGNGITEFQCPAGIGSDSMGQIYVADACQTRVYVFDEKGRFLRYLFGDRERGLLGRPTALAVSRDRRTVYLADVEQQRVVAFNQDGERLNEWKTGGRRGDSIGLSLSPGRVYTLEGARDSVQMFNSGGAPVGVLHWAVAAGIAAFVHDPVRRMYYVAEGRNQTILAFQEDGTPAGAFGQEGKALGEMATPGFLAVDPAGLIYAIDPLHSKVLVFREKNAPPRAPEEEGGKQRLKQRPHR